MILSTSKRQHSFCSSREQRERGYLVLTTVEFLELKIVAVLKTREQRWHLPMKRDFALESVRVLVCRPVHTSTDCRASCHNAPRASYVSRPPTFVEIVIQFLTTIDMSLADSTGFVSDVDFVYHTMPRQPAVLYNLIAAADLITYKGVRERTCLPHYLRHFQELLHLPCLLNNSFGSSPEPRMHLRDSTVLRATDCLSDPGSVVC